MQAMDTKVWNPINKMCVCEHLHTCSLKTKQVLHINIVIAGMVLVAAVNQKKRENGTTAQLLPDPVEESITELSGSYWSIENIHQAYPIPTPILTSGFLPANTLNISNRCFRDS